jgi:hypothetical protein
MSIISILLLALSTTLWATIFHAIGVLCDRGTRQAMDHLLLLIGAQAGLAPILGIIGTSSELSLAFGAGVDPQAAAHTLSQALAITTGGCIILGCGAIAHIVLMHLSVGRCPADLPVLAVP